MKQHECPNCNHKISFRTYISSTFEEYVTCPTCESRIFYDDIKAWEIYLYYNIFYILLFSSKVIENHLQTQHFVDGFVAVFILITICVFYNFLPPKGVIKGTQRSNNTKHFLKISKRVGSILLLTTLQFMGIIHILYKVFGKQVLIYLQPR